MVSLVNALGCKTTRSATCIVPCPVCHKLRQARRTWQYAGDTYIAVCPCCYYSFSTQYIMACCKEQGWTTLCKDYGNYEFSTIFLVGNII